MTNAIEAITNAQKEIENLTIADKELVNALLMSARRNVQIQLSDGSIAGFRGALDTMDKVKAIEDYIKVKVGQNLAELHTQNMVAAERLRIVRDIGNWLEKYLAEPGKNKAVNPDAQPEEYWLEDLGITRHQSSDWQMAAALDEKLFEDWLILFLDTALKKVDELYLSKLVHYARGKPESSYDYDNDMPSLAPPIKDVYLTCRYLKGALLGMIEATAWGSTPIGQVDKVFDQMRKTMIDLDSTMTKVGELYGVWHPKYDIKKYKDGSNDK